jgi:hypothetical protein
MQPARTLNNGLERVACSSDRETEFFQVGFEGCYILLFLNQEFYIGSTGEFEMTATVLVG